MPKMSIQDNAPRLIKATKLITLQHFETFFGGNIFLLSRSLRWEELRRRG